MSQALTGQAVKEAGDHPDLHEEPVHRAVGVQVRGGEEHEGHQRHPAEQPDLERGQRRHVRLGRLDQALAQRQAPHRGDREILEHDAQRYRGKIVPDVLRAERQPGHGRPQAEDGELGDDVAQRAPGAAGLVHSPLAEKCM